MAMGIEMMLKSFGLDPALLKQEIEKVVSGMRQEIAKLHTRIDDVEKTNERIEAKLDESLTLLRELTQWKRVHNPVVILNPPQPPQPQAQPLLPLPNQPPQPQ